MKYRQKKFDATTADSVLSFWMDESASAANNNTQIGLLRSKQQPPKKTHTHPHQVRIFKTKE